MPCRHSNFKYQAMAKQFLSCLLLFAWVSVASAQSDRSRDQVYIDLNSGFSIIDNAFTNTWDPYPPVHLNVRVPFYAGQLEGGLRYIRFEGFAPTETDSDFHSLFMHVGYSYPVALTDWFTIAPAMRFGNHLMIFDESEDYTTESGSQRYTTDIRESEFAYELALRNQFKLNNRWHLHAVLSYNHTLTYFPLSLTLFSVGVSYAFPEPNWLKDFIR